MRPRKELPSAEAARDFFVGEMNWHADCFYPGVELENAIAREVSRMVVIADAAAREIVAPRPWWVAAVAFLRKVVLL